MCTGCVCAARPSLSSSPTFLVAPKQVDMFISSLKYSGEATNTPSILRAGSLNIRYMLSPRGVDLFTQNAVHEIILESPIHFKHLITQMKPNITGMKPTLRLNRIKDVLLAYHRLTAGNLIFADADLRSYCFRSNMFPLK